MSSFCCSIIIICAEARGNSPAPLVPASSKIHSASRPCHHWSTRGDVRPWVGYIPKETLHCCAVVFTDVCPDSTKDTKYYAPYWPAMLTKL